MGAGKYRHCIKFQEHKQTGVDGVGQPIYKWVDFEINDDGDTGVYAEIKPIKGNEYWASQQVNSEATHRVTIRYIEGVNSEMRIVFGSRYFSIEPPINPDERNVELSMLCKENV